MSSSRVTIRDATTADGDAMLALLPRLADFEVPPHRRPEHLWQADAALLRRWLDGEADHCLVQVAVAEARIIGVTLTSLRPDPLSHAPGAHLEVIVVANGFEGCGVGRQLLDAAENKALAHGAEAMTLHVISSNARARAVYEQCGYTGEMLRYIKPLADS
ncbi:MAG: GNAT family N-acetyltransferase [Woeseiaceae bacterium]|nr:GNAT family N-acetyltransferase [Woeseiaceae bacterium]